MVGQNMASQDEVAILRSVGVRLVLGMCRRSDGVADGSDDAADGL